MRVVPARRGSLGMPPNGRNFDRGGPRADRAPIWGVTPRSIGETGHWITAPIPSAHTKRPDTRVQGRRKKGRESIQAASLSGVAADSGPPALPSLPKLVTDGSLHSLATPLLSVVRTR